MSRILGISAFYHDSAACMLEKGRIVAALQEERFSRIKHDSSFPARAVAAALRIAGIRTRDLDCVVFYEKPFTKFERLLETYLHYCPRGFASYRRAMPLWIKEKIWIRELIRQELEYEGEILFADHHESHAASAFYPSPFSRAALFTIDGVGEWTTTALGRGHENEIHLDSEIRFPHSLGLLYTTFTYYLGFEINSGEYKVMGLAPYGTPVYENLIREHLIEIDEDGSFRLNRQYFEFETGLRMASRQFEDLFEGPPRQPLDPLTQKHKDLAASVQRVVEETVLRICDHLHRTTGEQYLCMAGGVALNSVANGRIVRESKFEDLWVQPAAGDAGGALGAALAVWHRYLGRRRSVAGADSQQASLLGTTYAEEAIREFLERQGARFQLLDEDSLLQSTARALASGAVVGWFQGRMEFGPRALGCRSILADARHPEMKDLINGRVKYREDFRPFAPAVPENRAALYFEIDRPSPYMLLVAPVRPEWREKIPAVTHVDGSARVQTVNPRHNPRFYRLLEEYERQTGCAVVLNTSFNVRGEPIVESPRHAWECFMRTGIDYLVIGNCLLDKREQARGLEA